MTIEKDNDDVAESASLNGSVGLREVLGGILRLEGAIILLEAEDSTIHENLFPLC